MQVVRVESCWNCDGSGREGDGSGCPECLSRGSIRVGDVTELTEQVILKGQADTSALRRWVSDWVAVDGD